jgi:hypothetical protein
MVKQLLEEMIDSRIELSDRNFDAVWIYCLRLEI